MRRQVLAIAFVVSAAIASSSWAYAETSVSTQNLPQLGTAKTYEVLAATRIEVIGGVDSQSTNQGSDIGISTSFDMTGWDDRTIVGWTHFKDAAARTAQADLTKAYLKASTLPAKVIDSHLGGKTLKPGVYVSKTGLFWITGTLTLDTLGNKNSLFIFRTTNSISTSPFSKVVIKGNMPACEVYWRIPGMVTLGHDSTMYGHLMSSTYINSHKNVQLNGQFLIRNGGITMDSNHIKNQVCR